MQQLGASFGELTMLPSTPTEPLPPLPVEVDDACIFPGEILPQPDGIVPIITGFNRNVRIYNSYAALSIAEMTFGIDQLFDWDRQQRVLDQSLQRCKQVFDDLPDVLKVQSNRQNGGFGQQKQPYYPPMPEYMDFRNPQLNVFSGPESMEARRPAQYEIQKANIYASHLSIRSYIVEKYFALLEKNPGTAHQSLTFSDAMSSGLDRSVPQPARDAAVLEKFMSDEREQVVKDLLVVLGSIDMVNMEPNNNSFVSIQSLLRDSDFVYTVDKDLQLSTPIDRMVKNPLVSIPCLRLCYQTQKIRSIASTLLDVPKERKGSTALEHQDYLYKFLGVLSKLERVNPGGSDPSSGLVDEEDELRHWADLREYQLRFQERGGIYGYS
jgi:hypothetical protein